MQHVQVMVGLVLREHLMVLLRRCLAPGGAAAVAAHPVPYEELSRRVVTAAARSYVSEQQMAVLQAWPRCLASTLRGLPASHLLAGAHQVRTPTAAAHALACVCTVHHRWPQTRLGARRA